MLDNYLNVITIENKQSIKNGLFIESGEEIQHFFVSRYISSHRCIECSTFELSASEINPEDIKKKLKMAYCQLSKINNEKVYISENASFAIKLILNMQLDSVDNSKKCGINETNEEDI